MFPLFQAEQAKQFELQLKSKLDAQGKQLKKEHEMAIEIVENEAEAAAMRHAVSLEAIQKQLIAMEAMKGMKEKALEEVTALKEELEAALNKSKESLKEAGNALANERTQLQQQHAERLTNVMIQHSEELENVREEQREALIAEQKRIDQAQQAWQQQEDALKLQVRTMTAKYEQRESREEDVKAMEEMREHIVMLDQTRKKALEDLKFYKLELINREENFNKTFGRTPNVGVMQVQFYFRSPSSPLSFVACRVCRFHMSGTFRFGILFARILFSSCSHGPCCS